jgi:hypothetical protein
MISKEGVVPLFGISRVKNERFPDDTLKLFSLMITWMNRMPEKK